MLNTRNAMATVAVKDVNVARRFYRDTLGLEEKPGGEAEALLFASGNSTLLVYRSPHAGTNQATAVTWVLGDQLDAVVLDLSSGGVQFERYEFPGASHEGNVHVIGAMRAAWCKDPDGNILALVSH